MRVEVDPTGTIAGSSRSRAGPRVDVLDMAAKVHAERARATKIKYASPQW